MKFLRSIVCGLLGAAGCLGLGALGPGQALAQWTSAPVRDPERRFQKDVCSWKDLRESHIVMQQSDYSCGAASLATIARYYWGDDVDEDFFLQAIVETLTPEQLQDRMENGLSMADMRYSAIKRGYQATVGRRSLHELFELRVPVIVRIVVQEHEHFVVLRGIAYDRAFLADPIRGHVRVPLEEFARQWEDRALLVIAKPDTDLPQYAPLSLHPSEWCPVRPELQVPHRMLVLPPVQPVRRP